MLTIGQELASPACAGSGRSLFLATHHPLGSARAMQAMFIISIGGILGANVRYLLSTWAAGRYGTDFPYGTLLVNVAGSFLIGLVLGMLTANHADNPTVRLLLVTGFLGAETTFSTFAYESVALLRFGDVRNAMRNVIANVALGFGATAVGLAIAAIVSGNGPR